jgi:hypothetical protein
MVRVGIEVGADALANGLALSALALTADAASARGASVIAFAAIGAAGEGIRAALSAEDLVNRAAALTQCADVAGRTAIGAGAAMLRVGQQVHATAETTRKTGCTVRGATACIANLIGTARLVTSTTMPRIGDSAHACVTAAH